MRLANDRFEQFQNGLKRHSFRVDTTLLIDHASGRFRAMSGAYVCGGGQAPSVRPEEIAALRATLTAHHAANEPGR